MPAGTYPKSPRSIHVPPSNVQQWVPRSRSRRSRCLAIGALLLLWLFWYSHGSSDDPGERLPNGLRDDGVDWSRFAYAQYATNGAYLCNSIMVFEALQRLGSRASRILFYPEEWDTVVHHSKDRDSQLLVMARDTLNVKIIPMNMQSVRAQAPAKDEAGDEETWDFSVNKFLAWNQTQYERILHIDSDVTLLRHLDDLFFLPDAPVAMPRAYWELPHTRKLTSLLVLLKPSATEYEALMHAAYISEGSIRKFDMELLNDRYQDSALVLPHRGLFLLTGELRADDHTMYLGTDDEFWDTQRVLDSTRLVHFSDWPLPKPWIMWPHNLLTEMLPKCRVRPGTPQESGCQDRDHWRALYDGFRERRKDICKLLSVPAPQWPPPPKMSKSDKPKTEASKPKEAHADPEATP